MVSSSLGEPLRAEIELTARGEEWAGLTPRMAPPDAYQLAGFRYNPALAGSRLITRKQPNGRSYIELTSSRPVNEPFIYLLIQLDYNATRIMRGYTVLIDPPGFGLPAVSAPVMVPAIRSAAVEPGAARRRATAEVGVAARSLKEAARPPPREPLKDIAAAPAMVPAIRSAAVEPGAVKGRATAEVSVATRSQKEAAQPLPREPIKDIAAAPASTANLSGRIQRLEDKVDSSAKTLAGLMEQFAEMEEAIRRLQRGLEMQSSTPLAVSKPAVAEPLAGPAAVAKTEAAAVATTPKVPTEQPKEVPQPVASPPSPVTPTVEAPPARSPVAAKTEAAAPAEPQKSAAGPGKGEPSAPPKLPDVKAVPDKVTSAELSPVRSAPGRPNSMFSEALLVLAAGSVILVGLLGLLLWRRPRQVVTSEDILTKLLARDPQRDDVQLKLLEIYASRGDKTAYQNMAGKFHQLTGGEGDAWLKVASTGYELDPGNPLYVAGKYASMVASATSDANQVRH